LDAKGIEIVRRDNCPAVGKMQEKALRLLFGTRDGSQVKGWLVRQWQALLGHRVRANDYVFAKVSMSGTRGGGHGVHVHGLFMPTYIHVLSLHASY
jgi:DNA polymerase zeta